ncbi:hypothetical protein HID58_020497 [Brassica napus]|uniref:Uncharacterized protein n=1 Tax=Brassica napus TaxID=3708 RepID=A0ABQ7XGK9_BRANA|nr:hypothetical protein HID58_020497 [Brassica napus]
MFHHAPSFIFLIFFSPFYHPSHQNKTRSPSSHSGQIIPTRHHPAFPEQSDFSGCPLDLPEDLFHGIKSACTGKKLHKGKCCPVLGRGSTPLTRPLLSAVPSPAPPLETRPPPRPRRKRICLASRRLGDLRRWFGEISEEERD